MVPGVLSSRPAISWNTNLFRADIDPRAALLQTRVYSTGIELSPAEIIAGDNWASVMSRRTFSMARFPMYAERERARERGGKGHGKAEAEAEAKA